MAILRVREAFADFRTGHPVVFNPGDLLNSAHPAVKGREDKFETVDVAAARAGGVEQATATPGEKRSVSKRAAKKAAAKKTATKEAASPPAADSDKSDNKSGDDKQGDPS